MDGFRDRVVLVTGAASGIGAAVAEAFGASGAKVLVNDIRREYGEAFVDALRATGVQAAFLPGDVSSASDVEEMASQADARFGPIDVLVNNAGINEPYAPTEDQRIDVWQRVMDVHVRGTYLCSRRVGRTMVGRGRGKIVNVASIAGIVGLVRRNAYSSAKAAIIMFTRTLASEWARYGVNVNAVAPGYIMTPAVEEVLSQRQSTHDRLRRRIPMGQLGKPQDVADTILFLASDQARYVTGACLPVDGGWSAFGDAGDAFPL